MVDCIECVACVGTYVCAYSSTYVCNSFAVLMICACDIEHSLSDVLTVCHAFLQGVPKSSVHTK